MQKDSKTILAISYGPPLLNAGTITFSKIIKYLNRLGWSCEFIAVDEEDQMGRTDQELLSILPGETQIHRIRMPWLKGALRLPLLSFFTRLFYTIPAYRKMLKIAKEKKIDVIYSYSEPYSTHLAALLLKKKTGLPWLAHFMDPWADNPYIKNKPLKNYILAKLEAPVLRLADAVVFTSPQTKDFVSQRYPFYAYKMHAINHGFDPELIEKIKKDMQKDAGPVCKKCFFTYLGTFYGLRTPEYLFRAIRLLRDEYDNLAKVIRVNIVGAMSDEFSGLIKKYGIEDVVDYVKQVSYIESLKLGVKSNVLLLVDAPADAESIFFPAKLADYISFKKPILGITPAKGFSADLLRSLGHRIVGPEDVGAIKQALKEFIGLYNRNALFINTGLLRYAENFEAGKIALGLDEIIGKIRLRVKGGKKKVLIIGELPPPYTGANYLLREFLSSDIHDAFSVSWLNVSDRRPNFTRGRFDLINISLAIKHIFLLFINAVVKRPKAVYMHLAQNLAGFLRDSAFILVSNLLGVKVVLHFHGSGFNRFYASRGRLSQKWIRYILGRTSKIIVLSEGLRAVFDGLVDGRKLAVVPNCLNYQEFLPYTSERRSTGQVKILFLSKKMYAKGAIDFLHAIPIVSEKNKNIRFIIAGDVIESEEFPPNSGEKKFPEKEIREYVARGSFRDIVTIKNEVVGDEKIRLFFESDIFVLPSYGEGMPMVVLEAMGAGLPVIISPSGAMPEYIKDGENGLYIRPGDLLQLADKMLQLAGDTALREKMGKANMNLVKQNLDIGMHISAMKDVFESVTR